MNSDLTPGIEARRLPTPERHSAPTPLDVRQAKFSSAMRGYDKAEVNAFLLEAADGYEQTSRENERMRQEVVRLETALAQYRDLEATLKGALMSAQKISEEMKESANLHAARIVQEAEGKAELLLQRAQAQLEDIQREIDGMRLKRRESEVSLEAVIASLQSTLEYVREQGDHRMVQHRPHLGVAQSA
jgi:cell division initiation protein